MEFCEECGGIIDAATLTCSRCGKKLKAIENDGNMNNRSGGEHGKENWDLFQNKEHQICMNNHKQYESAGIDYPEIWMYIVSIFLPVLQWILVGVYVSKNDFKNAWGLLWKPLLIQIIFIMILIIKDINRLVEFMDR
ncbi:MAG: hypothetical protein PUB97_10470 [Ruminococcus sp.]|nr:hypothetical protein [Ruminococcus sp.]